MTQQTPVTSEAAARAWPQRRHYFWLAVFFTWVAVYGSLVPLKVKPVPWAEAVARFDKTLHSPLHFRSKADWGANVLLVLPISCCWMGTLAVDRRRRLGTILAVPAVVLPCALLSVGIEFAQIWFPPRVPSQNDVVAQLIGNVLGVALWLTSGQALTAWVRSSVSRRHPRQRLDWVLEVYLIGLVLYDLLPLDLTISPGDLLAKYREGQISLIPFAHFRPDFDGIYAVVKNVVLFIPLGMLTAIWHRPRNWPTRPLLTSILLGFVVVVAIEVAQLFLLSRYSDAGQVVMGTLGVTLGAWIMRRWRGSPDAAMVGAHASPSARRACLWLAVMVLYALFLTAFFCAPFDLVRDPREIRARYDGFFGLPFAGIIWGSWLNFAAQVVRKILFFSPMGIFAAKAVSSLSLPIPVRRIALGVLWIAAAGVGTGIELLQVFIVSHTPSITDVILYATGAAAGMLVTIWIVDARS